MQKNITDKASRIMELQLKLKKKKIRSSNVFKQSVICLGLSNHSKFSFSQLLDILFFTEQLKLKK